MVTLYGVLKMMFTKLLVTIDLAQLRVYGNSGDLLLQAFNQRSSISHNVNEKIFELVPPHKILKTCQMIRIRDLDRQVKFNQYKNNGYIEVFDGEYRREYYIDSVIFEEEFYI